MISLMKRRLIGLVGATLASSLVLAAPASAQFTVEGATWIKTAPPPGATDPFSIQLSSPASVAFKGFGDAPPALPPSYDFRPSVSGPSGGSPRLTIAFSDGNGQLRPLNLVAGQWSHEDGSSDWDSHGGTCGGRTQQSYANLLACHPGAQVISVQIVNDSGWLYPDGVQVFVDNVTYGGEIVSAPPSKREQRIRTLLSGDAKPPALGQRILVKPSGDVEVCPLPPCRAGANLEKKAEENFKPLEKTNDVPNGTTVDASAAGASAKLESAETPGGGQRQTARVEGGPFQVLQSDEGATRGLTEIRLKAGSFPDCLVGNGSGAARAPWQAAGAAWPQTQEATDPHAGKPKARNASKDDFGSRGKGGSARPRKKKKGSHRASNETETVWDTVERCDGTLFVVRRGEVTVRDFRRRRSIVLAAGKRYLAKAP